MDIKKLYETDKEFMERFEYFAFDEVVNEKNQELDVETRYLAILAVLLGSQAKEAFQFILSKALDKKVSPIMIKETVYQSCDYLGFGKMLPFLEITNNELSQRSISLPLQSQTTTTLETRLKNGIDVQVQIFGEHMEDAWKINHINRWLAENCFGDYYTRTGLSLVHREMITFCFLLSQGGCEPQLVAHAKGNMNLGNDDKFLMRVVSQCLPYIGYPRCLNAITCIKKALDE